ncbi:MAG: glycosyltransferase family 2 protein [Bacteroidia bacterium]|nr:glycosyltransferase family 2 protein [Bacteroidia bacterium]NNJ55835.1 glycosyltransferase family 2 protein [Bacteroidia bacterium]
MTFNLVIPVYNRIHSIRRLMNSILKTPIRGNLDIYISCDGSSSSAVVDYVNSIQWRHGEYKVIQQSKQLGVDAHILACMKMAKDLGHVILLEDDLVVSSSFQEYLLHAQKLIKQERNISGLSLYRYPILESNHFPFELIPNNEFIYYMQRPSSKGCFYSWDMLEPYFKFLETFDNDFESYHLPENVKKWSNEVWEKSFYCFLQHSGTYLAFPRYSLTSDFADIGVHMKKQTLKYVHQSKLYISKRFGDFNKLEETDNVYDSFYELIPRVVKKYNPELEVYDFEMDIYGNKTLSKISSEYLISEKPTNIGLFGWERRLKPEINNLLFHQEGEFYQLAKTRSFRQKNRQEKLKENFLYYYPDTRIKDLIKMKWSEIISRFI